jgi:hypothetical protein
MCDPANRLLSPYSQAFLTTLRDTYADLQAKENLLITMEGMQELEPVNPDELAFLEAEAAATRTQVLFAS